jgi:ketopantoate reductase
MDPSEENILIVGAGAIGVTLYAQICSLNLAPKILNRSAPVSRKIQLDGLKNSSSTAVELSYWKPQEERREHFKFSLIILTVKAFDLEYALTHTIYNMRDHIASNAVFITVCNGAIAPILVQSSAFWNAKTRRRINWRWGFCTFGVSKLAPHTLHCDQIPGACSGELLSPNQRLQLP